MKKFQKNYDILVIGNGSIGILTALLIKDKFPKKKIAILGSENSVYSASLAAGAMHGLYCEVESNFYESNLEQSNFEIGLKAREDWKKILKKLKLNKFITAKDTYFYLKKGYSDFEKKNYETACELAKNDKVLDIPSKNEIKKFFCGNTNLKDFECVKIKGEFGFNPKLIIQEIIKKLKKNGVDNIAHTVSKIVKQKNHYLIDNRYSTSKLIIAAGYGSYEIAKKIFNPVPVVKGVGTAFILQHDYFKKINSVVRTSNRGGAQCGLHIVPYDKKKGILYVGAGNYITREKNPWARTETTNYLIRLVKNELIPKEVVYETRIKPLIGYRPKSIDNNPSIGPVDESLFYVSGTYRAGLSWASFIAKQAVSWLEKNKVDKILNEYVPNRNLKTWGNLEEACNYYASSRLSNLNEHGLIKNEQKTQSTKFRQLYKFAKNKNSEIIKEKKFSSNFVIDPDCYDYFKK